MIQISPPVAVTTSSALVVTVPPGPVTVVLSNTGSTNVIYVGTTTNVTASGGNTGFPLPAGATITLPGFPGSQPTTLYAIAAATGNTLGVIMSTTN